MAAQLLPSLSLTKPPLASLIPTLLVFSLRALRSLYLALHEYVDPLDAERWTYDLVVSSAAASESFVNRSQNLVFSARTSSLPGSRSDVKSNNPRWQQQPSQTPQASAVLSPAPAVSAKKAGKMRGGSDVPFSQVAQDLFEELCLVCLRDCQSELSNAICAGQ